MAATRSMSSTNLTFPDSSATGMARNIFGRRFQNPVLLAAGTAGFGNELAGVMDLSRLGGLVTKSVSLEPRDGNPPPRVAEFRGGMLNSIGLANPGVARAAAHDLPALAAIAPPAQVIVSVVGFTVDEYAEVLARLDPPPAVAAIEINLSCPNTAAGGIEFGADRASVEAVLSACRRKTDLPLVAKLSPVSPDIADLARAAEDAGAAAITVVNTVPGRLLDLDHRPRLGSGRGGVSGPALFPVGLQATVAVLEATKGLPVIGAGGASTAADVRQYLAVGATLVQIGTASLADPRVPERIVRRLERAVV